jgi:hypothetical protein
VAQEEGGDLKWERGDYQMSITVIELNEFIQTRLKKLNLESVSPVDATKWLLKEGVREKMESRPGAYIRKLCRTGKIKGAEQKDGLWRIKRT